MFKCPICDEDLLAKNSKNFFCKNKHVFEESPSIFHCYTHENKLYRFTNNKHEMKLTELDPNVTNGLIFKLRGFNGYIR